MIDILRLDECLQIVLEDLGEVVLQLRATEVFENLLPVRGILDGKYIGDGAREPQEQTHIVAAKVRFQFSGEDLECSTLANTVGTNKPEYLAWSRGRKPMELEGVCGVTVRDLRFQVCR